jgi:hypothetical protein
VSAPEISSQVSSLPTEYLTPAQSQPNHKHLNNDTHTICDSYRIGSPTKNHDKVNRVSAVTFSPIGPFTVSTRGVTNVIGKTNKDLPDSFIATDEQDGANRIRAAYLVSNDEGSAWSTVCAANKSVYPTAIATEVSAVPMEFVIPTE